MRRLCLAVAMLLAACQMQAPKAVEANPPAGLAAEEAITVTPLGASEAKPASSAKSLAEKESAVQVPTGATPRPKPRPAGLTATKPAPAAAKAVPQASAPAEPPPPVSPEQALCQKSGGVWAASDSGGNVCVHRTRDGGKVCHRKTDCQGECLARSNTCAPIMPLMGCNDVLQTNGSEVTLCLQ